MSEEKERLDRMRERILGKSEIRNDTDSLFCYTIKNRVDSIENNQKPMTFTIHPDEVEILNKWKENIKGGFGFEVWAYSHLADREICLTKDVDY
jgi:hypothetical protein